MTLPSTIQAAGISILHDFAPGDLGQLIHLHGVQNFADYGFNHIHEAYCAQIAIEFILSPDQRRSRRGRWRNGEKRFSKFVSI